MCFRVNLQCVSTPALIAIIQRPAIGAGMGYDSLRVEGADEEVGLDVDAGSAGGACGCAAAATEVELLLLHDEIMRGMLEEAEGGEDTDDNHKELRGSGTPKKTLRRTCQISDQEPAGTR